MSSKSAVFFVAAIASLCMLATSHAQSGSRNAAPSFSPAPMNVSPPAPSTYAPAATPLQTITGQSRSVAPAPQPFGNSCPNCQVRGAASQPRPVVNYAPQSYATPQYSAPAPIQYAPRSVSYAPTYSAPVYRAPQYSPVQNYRPVQNYQPTYRSYAPARIYSGSCGGY